MAQIGEHLWRWTQSVQSEVSTTKHRPSETLLFTLCVSYIFSWATYPHTSKFRVTVSGNEGDDVCECEIRCLASCVAAAKDGRFLLHPWQTPRKCTKTPSSQISARSSVPPRNSGLCSDRMCITCYHLHCRSAGTFEQARTRPELPTGRKNEVTLSLHRTTTTAHTTAEQQANGYQELAWCLAWRRNRRDT